MYISVSVPLNLLDTLFKVVTFDNKFGPFPNFSVTVNKVFMFEFPKNTSINRKKERGRGIGDS